MLTATINAEGGDCKDPSHFLFSGFVYSYLHNPFSSYTVNILNVSYYLTIERDLVQVGLMSKDPSSLHCGGGTFREALNVASQCSFLLHSYLLASTNQHDR